MEVITLNHGTGGKESDELIRQLFVNFFRIKNVDNGVGLDDLDDGSSIPVQSGHFVFTMDSFTVKPLFFNGGNIGKLAATGTLNDLAVMGAKPLAVMDSIVIEEGFEISKLKEIINSFKTVLDKYNVALLGGDFKVMPKKNIDGIIITVVGIGKAEKLLRDSQVNVGDDIIVTGYIAEHGATILAQQMDIDPVESNLISDCKPVIEAIDIGLKVGGVHAAKDPTRGGLANALNEFATKSKVTIKIFEEKLPIRPEVNGVCEMLGVDPLYLASEGQVVMSVDPDYSSDVLKGLRKAGFTQASIIGKVTEKSDGLVLVETVIGGLRVLESPTGIPLPRIC